MSNATMQAVQLAKRRDATVIAIAGAAKAAAQQAFLQKLHTGKIVLLP